MQALAHRGLARWLGDVAPISVLLLVGSFALVRLLAIPVLQDEGTDLRWIWRILEAGDWSTPLIEGKPLEAWPLVPLLRLGAKPLFAIRAAHVLAGMLGVVLTYCLTRQLADRLTAFAAGTLFAVCPFVIYLERFALPEILMCAAQIWLLLAIHSYRQAQRWPQTASLAVALATMALSELPAGFAGLLALPLALLLMPASERHALLRRAARRRLAASQAPTMLLLALMIGIISSRLLLGLDAGFGWRQAAPGSSREVATVMGVSPLNIVAELATQLSWPVLALAAVGIGAALVLHDWRLRWLSALGMLPVLGVPLAKSWYPRDLLLAVAPLIVVAAVGFRTLALRTGAAGKAVALSAWLVCLGYLGQQSLRLVLNPTLADWSPIDRFEYFEGWGSGYGYPAAAAFILNAPEPAAQILSLDPHSAYQLRCYLPAAWYSRVHAIDFSLDSTRLSSPHARLENLLQQPSWILIAEQLLPRYLVETFGADYDAQLSLRRVASFAKPGARVQLTLYEARAK